MILGINSHYLLKQHCLVLVIQNAACFMWSWEQLCKKYLHSRRVPCLNARVLFSVWYYTCYHHHHHNCYCYCYCYYCVLALGSQHQLQSEIWRRTVSPAPLSTVRAPKPVSITNIAQPLSARLPVFGLPALIPFYTDELSICWGVREPVSWLGWETE